LLSGLSRCPSYGINPELRVKSHKAIGTPSGILT
jgi:hypothetical protein